jgi:hypothetical protein
MQLKYRTTTIAVPLLLQLPSIQPHRSTRSSHYRAITAPPTRQLHQLQPGEGGPRRSFWLHARYRRRGRNGNVLRRCDHRGPGRPRKQRPGDRAESDHLAQRRCDASASSSNMPAGKYNNQCHEAITAAQAATAAGTWVYTIAYSAATSGSCSTDSPTISACST